MPNEKSHANADINALAAEALDLWQEQLTHYASDPKAKAELMKLMEPGRQWFADLAMMMQSGPYGADFIAKSGTAASGAGHKTASTARPASARVSSDDGALEFAQLAHHVAILEKRVAELEKSLTPRSSSPSAKSGKRTKS